MAHPIEVIKALIDKGVEGWKATQMTLDAKRFIEINAQPDKVASTLLYSDNRPYHALDISSEIEECLPENIFEYFDWDVTTEDEFDPYEETVYITLTGKKNEKLLITIQPI